MRSLVGTLVGRASRPSYAGTRSWHLPFAHANTAETRMRTMLTVSTVFAIVARIGDATSQVEWKLWRKRVDGRRTTATEEPAPRVEVTRHAALDLLNEPNLAMTREEFIAAVDQHADLAGEADIVVVRSSLLPGFDVPLELWPVRPDRMTPVPHPERFLAGWIYTGPDGQQVPLETDDVIQLKRAPHPLNPYRGLGPVEAAMIDIESSRLAAEWNRNFFLNSAEPGGIVEFDHPLSDDEWNKFVARWREQHQGVAQAHRVAVLEMGKWVERKYSMKDLDFANLRGVSREIIREAFGIHPHMLGLTEDVNKANAQEGERSWARWLVRPRANTLRGVLNRRLLPMFGGTADGVEFDHDRVVPEDREADDRERTSKAQAAQLLVTAGYDPDDVASAVGLPAMTFAGRQPAGAAG